MPMNEYLLPEFDQEIAITRRVLDSVADDTFAVERLFAFE